MRPREILSPAVARNGFASFHIAVSVPPKESYFLYVVTNPIEACHVALYKEHFVKTPSGWIPDRLTEVHRLPDFGVMPDPDDGVEGQTTRVYLLDLWIPPTADLSRFRVEVQLKVAGGPSSPWRSGPCGRSSRISRPLITARAAARSKPERMQRRPGCRAVAAFSRWRRSR